jgi:hypothetical protein
MTKDDVRYYIKHPNGRERIQAASDAEARRSFKTHWTAVADWYGTGTRVLMKETRAVLVSEGVGRVNERNKHAEVSDQD